MTRFKFNRWQVLVAVHAFIAANAFVGGTCLAVWPDGSMLRLPLQLLEHSPFHDYLLPGIFLYVGVGVSNFDAALFAWRQSPGADVASIIAGAALAIFVTVQMALLHFFPFGLPIICLGLGLVLVAEGLWNRFSAHGSHRPGLAL